MGTNCSQLLYIPHCAKTCRWETKRHLEISKFYVFCRRRVNRFQKINNKDTSIKSLSCLTAAITLCLQLMIAADVDDFLQITEDNVRWEDSSQASTTAVVCVHVHSVVSARSAPWHDRCWQRRPRENAAVISLGFPREIASASSWFAAAGGGDNVGGAKWRETENKGAGSHTSSQQLDPGNKTSQHDGTSEGHGEGFFCCQRAKRKLGNPSLGSLPWTERKKKPSTDFHPGETAKKFWLLH